MRAPRLLAAALGILALSGCHVPNRPYNPVPSNRRQAGHARVSPASIVRVGGSVAAKRTDTFEQDCDPAVAICLAFVEFDDMGEFWDPQQLPAALRLIKRARDSGRPPVVVTFIHGWKNNAAEDDRTLEGQNGNIVGFEGVLEDLKGEARFKDAAIVGIFIGWRGDFVPPYWPVRRQFSYFNREKAAIRLPGAAMTSALRDVAAAVRAPAAGAQRGVSITIGHSFGGLILERALSQAIVEYIRSVDAPGPETWADLTVLVNSAAAASEGKQLLNVLKTSHATYGSDGRAWPLLLSVSSLGDAATRFLMPFGHGLPFLAMRGEGSFRDYDVSEPPGITSQSAFYLSTTAHMPALQSHVVLDLNGAANCEAAGSGPHVGDPFTLPAGPKGTHAPKASPTRYQICQKPGRWNDTPYWAMQMPVTIVPDHSGIFNQNFVALLINFLPTAEELEHPERRRTLKVNGR